jgi:hypothetical protein
MSKTFITNVQMATSTRNCDVNTGGRRTACKARSIMWTSATSSAFVLRPSKTTGSHSGYEEFYFLNISPYSPHKVSRRFGGKFRSSLRLHLNTCFHTGFLSAYSSTLKMEATCSSEMSIGFQKITKRYIELLNIDLFVKVKIMLRPTVNRPVCLRPNARFYYIRQLLVC